MSNQRAVQNQEMETTAVDNLSVDAAFFRDLFEAAWRRVARKKDLEAYDAR